MLIDVDRAASAVGETLAFLFDVLPTGWSSSRPGLLAGVSGVPIPVVNGVWVIRGGADPSAVIQQLDAVSTTGMPHCLQLRNDRLSDIALGRGMARADDLPLMVIDDAAVLPHPHEVEGVRRLGRAESEIHTAAAAAAYGAPIELFNGLAPAELFAQPGVHGYVIEVDGEPVSTGLGMQVNDHVCIFNVVTAPAHRRRGYGAALTAAATRDGFANGAQFVWLQATPDGFPVYEALGFETVERWECWVAEPSNPDR